jgi:hypothetical protein
MRRNCPPSPRPEHLRNDIVKIYHGANQSPLSRSTPSQIAIRREGWRRVWLLIFGDKNAFPDINPSYTPRIDNLILRHSEYGLDAGRILRIGKNCVPDPTVKTQPRMSRGCISDSYPPCLDGSDFFFMSSGSEVLSWILRTKAKEEELPMHSLNYNIYEPIVSSRLRGSLVHPVLPNFKCMVKFTER